jgi:DNA processing protein
VIGTRNNSGYGKQFTEKLINDLSASSVTVISGLAFGIDALAHKASLKHGLPTVGVLAHGLDQVYPVEHAQLAKDMVREGGGLLTEFFSGTKPDRHNFPSRNRIVAGMSDATIVVESGDRGGSLITAELANSYNRDVFAVPGKTTDSRSSGCNTLIKNNKAVLLTSAADLLAAMGWDDNRAARPKIQKEMFLELSANEQAIVTILEEADMVDIDTLRFRSGLTSSAVAAALLNLEIQNAILSLPGKQYRLS